MTALTLVSHHLCPYVQRAAIALAEKEVPFERISVDLSEKPSWFRALSPLGKVPLLKVARSGPDAVIFESAVILEYLEETQARPLHPADPLERARHRSWIEFGSQILNGIARFYNAKTDEALQDEAASLAAMFDRVEATLDVGPWFAGRDFSLVDAAYAPIFRYFNVFEQIAEFGVLKDKQKTAAWRAALAERASVRDAVGDNYNERLLSFLRNRKSALSSLLQAP
ncbi:MAG: glutathione S-transferase family protein [Erythrobacter sp.]|nr:glutathione S-transferase family protein [Erythrobacter sp.]